MTKQALEFRQQLPPAVIAARGDECEGPRRERRTHGRRSTPPESGATLTRDHSRVRRSPIDDPSMAVAEFGPGAVAKPCAQPAFDVRRRGTRILSPKVLTHEIHSDVE